MLAEGYVELFMSGPHWLFELTLMAVVDGLIGLVLWPRFKAWVHRHDAAEHPKGEYITQEALVEMLNMNARLQAFEVDRLRERLRKLEG